MQLLHNKTCGDPVSRRHALHPVSHSQSVTSGVRATRSGRCVVACVALNFQTFDLCPLTPACSRFKSFLFNCMFTAAEFVPIYWCNSKHKIAAVESSDITAGFPLLKVFLFKQVCCNESNCLLTIAKR